jgi:oxaloacetate decarboxylase gamma subunit
MDSMMGQGVELMIAGMGTVFVFLTCLVLATTMMSALVHRFHPEPAAEALSVTDEEVAVISAAIIQHRKNRELSKSEP